MYGHRGAGRFATRKVRHQMWQSVGVPLFYQNPLGADFQAHVGRHSPVVEMFDFLFQEPNLLDTSRKMNTLTIAWARILPCLPWMNRSDRPAMLFFTTVGKRLVDGGNLSETLKQEIAAAYPRLRRPPSLDDTRPSETSWTYFKKRTDAKRSGPRPTLPVRSGAASGSCDVSGRTHRPG